MQQFQCYIDGRFSNGEARFQSVDPATGAAWAQMPESREADVDRAVEAAHQALHGGGRWARMTATQRGKLLYRLADLIAASVPRLAELETRDTGKIIRETSSQIAYVADYYRYYAGLADKIEGAFLPIDKPDMDVWLRREPVGVVAAIVPWNSQLFLAAVKIGPALAAGCTIVVKASEDGPAPLLEFARLVDEAGFPPGVVNVITGFGATCGAALDRASEGRPYRLYRRRRDRPPYRAQFGGKPRLDLARTRRQVATARLCRCRSRKCRQCPGRRHLCGDRPELCCRAPG